MRTILCVVKAVKRREIGWISLSCFLSCRMVLLVYYLRTSNSSLRGHLIWNQFHTSFLRSPLYFFFLLKSITSKCIYVVGNCFALARFLNLKRFSQQTASLHLCRTASLITNAVKWNWQHYFMLAYQQQNDSTAKLKT